MTLHVQATTGCNLGCSYCYENPDRERKQEWVDRQYDLDEIFDRLNEFGHRYDEVPGLHGGEPLLMRTEDIEAIFEWVYERYDRGPAIQTNGTLIDDKHIELFRDYDVHVGVSCDGPAELNRERQAAGERETDRTNATDSMTGRTVDAIERMIEEGIPCSVITVVHETNAGTDERLEKLLDWIDWLCRNGVTGHYNPAIPYDDIQNDVSVGPERLKEVYLRTWEWMKAEPYRSWNPMEQMVDNLIGNGTGGCVNRRCDVFNTRDAKSIKGNGESSGCGKTWSAVGDGVPFLQGPTTDNEYEHSNERYDVLKNTPGPHGEETPDMGGCKGCTYWNVCQGGCPSAGINDDWRNRSIWCEAKYALYERIEHDIRAIFPNVTLVTDFPWDAELSRSDMRKHDWSGDFKPFSAVRPGTRGPSSASRAAADPAGPALDRVPNRVLPDRLRSQKSGQSTSTGWRTVTEFDTE
ncbi:radical SAM protein [Halovivax cerinus]|uniref:Radical SAM protein n=1 Tax=Halovivax cerinus TaxID=1487865 RepID=A0ABD5NKS3_9EURY|nr:radical SAM protein [Halovivax cerinus]